MAQASLAADEIIASLRAHESELRRVGIRQLSLFGSVARGQANAESDIDLVAELEPNANVGLFRLSAIESRLSQILGRKVDLLLEPVEKPRLQSAVERDRRRAF